MDEFRTIVRRLKAQDNTPLADIYNKYGSYCIRQLNQSAGCPHSEASDVLMDAIIDLRDRIVTGKVDQINNLRGYLLTSCRHLWLKRVKWEQATTRKSSDLERFYYHARYNPDDYDALIRQEDVDKRLKQQQARIMRLHQALASLPGKCKRILELFYLKKVSMKEIAIKMGFAGERVAITTKARCYKKWIELSNIKIAEHGSR